MTNLPWWAYVILAGLAWGTYVPLIFYGGTELTTKPGTIGGRLASILCVGGAYFVLAVVIPVVLMATRDDARPDWKTAGLVFSALAGAAGAIGAICVIFASKAAVDAAKLEGVNPATYRIYIAPLIFCLAPLINTLVSSVWHPKPGDPFHFALEFPGWKLWLGIILVAAGTFFVLYSKEEAEAQKSPAAKNPAAVAPPANIVPAGENRSG
jgi:drug/metabolite transporter (DMT)-like permease